MTPHMYCKNVAAYCLEGQGDFGSIGMIIIRHLIAGITAPITLLSESPTPTIHNMVASIFSANNNLLTECA